MFIESLTMLSQQLQGLLQKYPLLDSIVPTLHHAGGRVLLVGGAVRDLFLGLTIKDIDIEVHNLSLEQLESLLSTFGPVSTVGKAFGVVRLHGFDGDWSIPRSDAQGRKPSVTLDPSMSIQEAFRRRDLTMNAMGIDLVTHELIDPYGGVNDMRAKTLRTPDVHLFVEDPLRFYRVMQFIGRFEMKPDSALNNLCSSMDISSVSRERKEAEFSKLLLKSKRPSLGIRWLKSIGRLQEVLPELAATVGIHQNPQWHPEGDVFEHSMQALDAAATLSYPSDTQKLIILYSALCHDLGKAVTTRTQNDIIISYGHEIEGVFLARKLLKRITATTSLVQSVEKLVRYHMAPLEFIQQGAKNAAYKRLAQKLSPDVTMHMLADLAYADRQGRNPHNEYPLLSANHEIEQFRAQAAKNNVLTQAEKPVLTGKDLLNIIQPGKEMGRLLKKAYEIQIEKDIHDKEELKKRILQDYDPVAR